MALQWELKIPTLVFIWCLFWILVDFLIVIHDHLLKDKTLVSHIIRIY